MSANVCLGCNSSPVMRKSDAGKYRAECSNKDCRWNHCDGGSCSRQGAEVAWNRANAPNNDWILYHWWRRCLVIHGLPQLDVALSSAEIQNFNQFCLKNYGDLRYARAA